MATRSVNNYSRPAALSFVFSVLIKCRLRHIATLSGFFITIFLLEGIRKLTLRSGKRVTPLENMMDNVESVFQKLDARFLTSSLGNNQSPDLV